MVKRIVKHDRTHEAELQKLDRAQRAKAAAKRTRRELVLAEMPKVYFIDWGDRIKLGRTDWPADKYIEVHKWEFGIFERIYDHGLNMPLFNKTEEDHTDD